MLTAEVKNSSSSSEDRSASTAVDIKPKSKFVSVMQFARQLASIMTSSIRRVFTIKIVSAEVSLSLLYI